MNNTHNFVLKSLVAGLLVTSVNAYALEIEHIDNNIAFTDLQHTDYALTVSTPDNEVFKLNINNQSTVLTASMLNKKAFDDGTYKFELTPVFKTGQLGKDVRALNNPDVLSEFKQEFSAHEKYSGSFAIQDNQLLPALQESSNKDQVINDDSIVQGRICVGIDCVNAENFGSASLLLKDKNLRIRFNDTTDNNNSNSFPDNDWQITINDTSNGGENKFSIDDITNSKTPFTIEADAPNNALFIDTSGNLGIKTNSPTAELHMIDGNTPTIRMEQDGSGGFAPQTFDIGANETSFFIRDVTNGNNFPLRINPGSGTADAIVIAGNGNVGIGTASPDSSMHLRNTDGTANFLIEETNATIADRRMLRLSNKGGVRLDLENTSGGPQANNWRLGTENNTGSFIVTEVGSGDIELEITTTGDILARGVVVHSSDVNKKKNIVEVDPQSVLQKVSQLPISTWQYKNQTDGVTHMGPMAQDFRKAFGLGLNDITISDTDVAGVALASIKALTNELKSANQRQQSIQLELQAAHKKNQRLEQRLFSIERQLIDANKDATIASN